LHDRGWIVQQHVVRDGQQHVDCAHHVLVGEFYPLARGVVEPDELTGVLGVRVEERRVAVITSNGSRMAYASGRARRRARSYG
jgi:hypothetical protein